jgi:RNA polymerase sigma-70 factor, ECF subfamily
VPVTLAPDRIHQLVLDSSPAVLAYFERRVDVREDAADLLGETLLVVWRRRDALPADEIEARMWMFGIARRVILSYRRGGVRRVALVERLRTELNATPGDVEPDPRLDLLGEALAELPERDLEIVRLVAWDGFSLADVAQHLRIPAGTVRSRYSRARAVLRSRLER